MIKEKTLMNSNRISLIIYLALNYLVFVTISGLASIEVGRWDDLLRRWLAPEGITMGILYCLCIILEGVISSDIKAILVFWRLRNPLPGTRAFSEIAINDPRIDMNKLTALFSGKLPVDPREQNAAWFSLYKKYSNVAVVLESHKAFLLARDLAGLTIVIILISVIGHIIFFTNFAMSLFHILILIGVYSVIAIAGRNYGNRFVANVLVEASLDKGRNI